MKSVKIKLPFGLNEYNDLVHITDVVSGKQCSCVCLGCRSPLIAAKGVKNQHHFKHAVTTECEGGLESAIHLAAKKIITERKKLTLSECIATVSATDSTGKEHKQHKIVIAAGTIIDLDQVEEEKELHGMKADLLVTKRGRPLIVEIFYRHKVDEQKIDKIKSANISAIEIDLSDLKPEDVKDWEAFWASINSPARIQWLYNVGQERAYPKLNKQVAAEIDRQEKKYEQEKILKRKIEQKEKAYLVRALEDLTVLCSATHIAQLTQEAVMHPVWKIYSQFVESFDESPTFLNLDVPNGDWIFGCDRRIWQTTFYNSFIYSKKVGYYFSTRRVNDWLKDKAMCKIPLSVPIIGKYGRRYFEHLPTHIAYNLPSSWKTLGKYFDQLCKLGMLEYSGAADLDPGSSWYKVISKTPDAAECDRRRLGLISTIDLDQIYL